MKKTAALANALRSTGAKVSTEAAPVAAAIGAPVAASVAAPTVASTRPTQTSRIGTKPITLHLNEETRRQLKALAAEQGRTVESMGAEAFNLLFARYRKPEVAVAKGPRS